MACDAKESMALDKVIKTLMPRLAGIRHEMVGKEDVGHLRLSSPGFFSLDSHGEN